MPEPEARPGVQGPHRGHDAGHGEGLEPDSSATLRVVCDLAPEETPREPRERGNEEDARGLDRDGHRATGREQQAAGPCRRPVGLESEKGGEKQEQGLCRLEPDVRVGPEHRREARQKAEHRAPRRRARQAKRPGEQDGADECGRENGLQGQHAVRPLGRGAEGDSCHGEEGQSGGQLAESVPRESDRFLRPGHTGEDRLAAVEQPSTRLEDLGHVAHRRDAAGREGEQQEKHRREEDSGETPRHSSRNVSRWIHRHRVSAARIIAQRHRARAGSRAIEKRPRGDGRHTIAAGMAARAVRALTAQGTTGPA